MAARLLQDVRQPWRHFAICALLNRARGAQVAELLPVLFRRHPTARALARADEGALAELLRPLGMQRVRARRLREIAAWFEAGNVPVISGSPPGAGRYAMDSFQILFLGHAPDGVTDRRLLAYLAERGGRPRRARTDLFRRSGRRGRGADSAGRARSRRGSCYPTRRAS